MMDTVSRIKNAKNQQEAFVILAQAIDNVYTKLSQPEPEGGWGNDWSNDGPEPPEEYVQGEVVERIKAHKDEKGNVTVELPEATEKVMKMREWFAEHAQLEGQVADSYLNGGAYWLYVYDRQFVMSLPDELRQKLVLELAETNPADAFDMGRDILKDTSPGGGPKTLEEAIS